jgi:hypothetical protein
MEIVGTLVSQEVAHEAKREKITPCWIGNLFVEVFGEVVAAASPCVRCSLRPAGKR